MEKRYVYLEKIEANLAQYNAKLTEMKAKVAEIQSDMKSEYLSQVDSLEKKRDEFLVKYGQLKETSGHAWEDVKAGTEKAWNELEDSIEKAISRFK
jgi:F0F1-type ATP synthase membrane subunit b/b'